MLDSLDAAIADGAGLLLPVSVAAQQRLAVLDRLVRSSSRLHGLLLTVLGDVDATADTVQVTGLRTAGWLAATAPMPPGQATRLVADARALPSLPEVSAGLAAGRVSSEQTSAIRRAINDLPRDAPAPARSAIEHLLVQQCDVLDPVSLRRLGERAVAILDPVAEEDAEDAARRREEARWTRRRLALNTRQDGMVTLNGLLPVETAELLRVALDPLAAPSPATDGTPDPRGSQQRTADALHEMTRRYLIGPNNGAGGGTNGGGTSSGTSCGGSAAGIDPSTADASGPPVGVGDDDAARPQIGGAPATVLVTISLQALQRRSGPGWLTRSGAPLPAEHVRRLACDARLIPAVLDGAGVPLELGRARRLVSTAQRHALTVRDAGCAFPGCTRPPSWCDAHHIQHWTDGGPTDLDNLVLLCGEHHRLLHANPDGSGWQVRLGPERRPEFLPPRWVDPDRRPRHNPRRRE
jgi:hypothetical protein